MAPVSSLTDLCKVKVISMLSEENLHILTLTEADQVASFVQEGMILDHLLTVGNTVWDVVTREEEIFQEWSPEYFYCIWRSFHQAMDVLHLPIMNNFPYYEMMADRPEEGKGIQTVIVGLSSNKILRKCDTIWLKLVGPFMKHVKALFFTTLIHQSVAQDPIARGRIADFARSFSSLKDLHVNCDRATLDMLSVGFRHLKELKTMNVKFIETDVEMSDVLEVVHNNLPHVETLEIHCFKECMRRNFLDMSVSETDYQVDKVKKMKLHSDEFRVWFTCGNKCPTFPTDSVLTLQDFFKDCRKVLPNLEEMDLCRFRLNNWKRCLHRNVWPVLTKLNINGTPRGFAPDLKTIGRNMPKLESLKLRCFNEGDKEILGMREKDLEAIKGLTQIKSLSITAYKAKAEVLQVLISTLPNLESLNFRSTIHFSPLHQGCLKGGQVANSLSGPLKIVHYSMWASSSVM